VDFGPGMGSFSRPFPVFSGPWATSLTLGFGSRPVLGPNYPSVASSMVIPKGISHPLRTSSFESQNPGQNRGENALFNMRITTEQLLRKYFLRPLYVVLACAPLRYE
jgi:hypothetical protein